MAKRHWLTDQSLIFNLVGNSLAGHYLARSGSAGKLVGRLHFNFDAVFD